MNLLVLIKLIESNPDRAAEIILNLYKNGYYTDFSEIINLNKLVNIQDINSILTSILDEILSEKLDNEKLVKKAHMVIDRYTDELVNVLYERSDKALPKKEFTAYLLEVYDKTPEELSDYEDNSFTYEGHKIKSEKARIYDSLAGIINYLNDEISQEAHFTPEELTFFQQKREEIVRMLESGDIEGAKRMLVALQLFMHLGTKFKTELKEFILGDLSLNDILEIDVHHIDTDLDNGRTR